MKKTTYLILLYLLISNNIFAQINKADLHNNSNKTWIISELKMGTDIFQEQAGTCVYKTEVTFYKNNKAKTYIPCSGFTEESTYKFYKNGIILKTDTLEFVYLNSSAFKTKSYSVMQSENMSQEIPIEMTYTVK